MRAWWALVAGVSLIVLGYAGDQVVGAAFRQTGADFSSGSAVVLDGLARVFAVVLMVAVAWLVMAGPRDRMVGLAMLIVGGYVALVPPISFALLTNTGIALPPLAVEAYESRSGFMLWAGALVLVLGVIELAWPTTEPEPETD